MDECCRIKLKWEVVSQKGDDFKMETSQCSRCGMIYRRKNDSFVYLKEPDDDDYYCFKCGGEAVTAPVTHVIKEGIFSVSRRHLKAERVMFCQFCELPPDPYGWPLSGHFGIEKKEREG